MKIVYLSSESTDPKLSKKIIELCEAQGHKVFDGTIPETANEQKLIKFVNVLTAEMKKSDAIIVEATHSTFDLGRFITMAIQQHRPILLLHQNDLSRAFLFGSTRMVQHKQYSEKNVAELETQLKDYFRLMKRKKLTYRFNLMISRDLNSYLMDKARYSGMSKADYVRNLVMADMDEQDKDM